MHTQQISVFELETYWKALGKGENVENIAIIPSWRMPPWNEICSELGWRKYLVGGGYFSKKHHGYCGVYRLIGLATEDDLKSPATLNRVCGQDTTGTLYIGKAGRLHERLNQIRLSTHNAIRALERTSLKKIFPSNKLAIAMLFTDCKMRSFVEQNLIEAYMMSFGDTPPLNYLVNR